MQEIGNEEINQNSSDKKQDITTRFIEERDMWTTKVKEIAKRFKVVEDMAEVQIDLYSNRQDLIEYMQRLSGIQNKVKTKWLTEYRKAYDDLSLNQDYRYAEKDKAKFAEELTSALKSQIDLIQVHIEFFKETIKTIDTMCFGIKHRIDIEDFKRGVK